MIVLALGDLGLDPEEFWGMSLTRFLILVDAHHRKAYDKWRHTRLILAALTGKDPRHLVPLPGDFEELKIMTFEERMSAARSTKMFNEEKLKEIEARYKEKHGRN